MECAYYTKENGKTIVPKDNVKSGTGVILVIDDDPTFLRISQGVLTGLGYTVLLAEDGFEGLLTYKEKHTEIDLVLLDFMMPIMTGDRVFKKLKEINKECNVILISGNIIEDEVISKMYDNGLNSFIEKPYCVSALSEVIYDVIMTKV